MTLNAIPDQLELTAEQEPVRCSVCGTGATAKSWAAPAAHVATTISAHGASHEHLDSDHEPVCDNVAPDGTVYPFGRIVNTETIGDYTIATTTRVKVDGSTETSYVPYIATTAHPESGKPQEVRSTSTSHASLEEAIVYAITHRHVGPNSAWPITDHFLRGLRD